MNILRPAKRGDTVRVHYRGKLKDCSMFDTSFGRGPLQFPIGRGDVIRGFEEAVIGMKPGDSKTTELSAEKAFGNYRNDRVALVDKSKLAERCQIEPKPGERVQIPLPDGPPLEATVSTVTESEVTLDANDALAGKDVVFDIELIGILEEGG